MSIAMNKVEKLKNEIEFLKEELARKEAELNLVHKTGHNDEYISTILSLTDPFIRELLINNSPLGIFIINLSTLQIEYTNKTLTKYLGYTKEEFKSKKFVDLHQPTELPRIFEQFAPLIQETAQEVLIKAVPHIHKDCSVVSMEILAKIVELNSSKVILAFAKDISDMLEQQKALETSEIKYRRLFRNAPIGLWEENYTQVLKEIDTLHKRGIKNIEKYCKENREYAKELSTKVTITNLNKAALTLHGASNEQELQKGLQEIFTEESLDTFINLIRNFELNRTYHSTETVVKTITGEKKNIDFRCFMDYDDNNTALISTADITEQKKAITEVQIMKTAIEQSPSSIVITSIEGNIEYVNPKFCELTGYSFKEALGKNPRILKSHTNNLVDYKEMWNTLTSGKVWEGEFHNRKKDGTPFVEQATISPIINKDGEIIHYVAVKEDITEKRRMRDQIHQKQRLEAIGQLAGGVAHDFNNILTAILGHADSFLSNCCSDSNCTEDVIEIRHSAERAAHLTQQLLIFSRKEQINKEIFDINELITNLKKMLIRLIPEDINFIVNTKEEPIFILADPGQVEQVIVNFIVNSVDAIHDHPNPTQKDITLSTRKTTKNKEHICKIEIKDSGAGISSDVLPHIFEPFYTTKDKFKGTGLGLSTIYGIVKQNSADIDVKSTELTGTTFTVSWPLAIQPTKTKVEVTETTSDKQGSEVILFVEDDQVIRRLISRHLESLGYTTITAANGLEALDKYDEQNGIVDLLFTDVVMPIMDGQKLAKEIRKRNQNIPILFASGYLDNELHQDIQNISKEYFINKPYTLKNIGPKLRALLDKKE